MRKFEKILKITAIICSVVLVMGIFGTVVGVNKFFNGDYKALVESGRFEGFDKGEKITNSFEKDKVKNIEIDSDLGSITIKENSDSKEIKVTSSHKKYTEMELVDGKLVLKLKDNFLKRNLFDILKQFNIGGTNRNMIVEIPKDYVLDSVTAKVDVGEINITSSSYKNLDVVAKMGDVNISPSKYTLLNSLNVTNNMGDSEINNVDGINSKITNSMGSTRFTINNEVNPKVNSLTVKNNMGDVYVGLNNIDRNINISCSMGSVDLISKNHLSKDVSINLNNSIGDSSNNFQYGDIKLNKSVNVSVDVSMGSAKLSH